jgi:hypothetical protein
MDPIEPLSFEVPPFDPEEWTDERWLEWLKATDDVRASGTDVPVTTLASRVVRSAPGQMLGQAMIGMAQAIYGRQDDEIVIVVEGNSEPHEHELFTIRLDLDHPERSSVVFKSGSESPD